ncbi:MAG: hypothetical protein NTY15_04115 [Planctomycetota bacterium]|nr:hypothetical protein [Planctomycetota bacterium]
MNAWVNRKEEESYLGQLEQLVVQRLQKSSSETAPPAIRVRKREQVRLNKFSIEMNEELNRLESMIAEEQNHSL